MGACARRVACARYVLRVVKTVCADCDVCLSYAAFVVYVVRKLRILPAMEVEGTYGLRSVRGVCRAPVLRGWRGVRGVGYVLGTGSGCGARFGRGASAAHAMCVESFVNSVSGTLWLRRCAGSA